MGIIDFRARPNTDTYLAIYDDKPGADSWQRFGYARPEVAPLESFMGHLERNQVDLAVFTGRQGALGYLSNEYIASCVKAHPERLIGMAGLDARSNESVREGLEWAITPGFKGISLDPPDGPTWDGRGYDDSVHFPVYEAAAQQGLIVVMTMGPLMGRHADPNAIDRIATKYPNLKIVCSHGCWPRTQEWIALCYRHQNVYIEASIYEFLPGGEDLVSAMDIIGTQVLYGSAYPFNGLDIIEKVATMGWTEDAFDALVSSNARRLLGLPTADRVRCSDFGGAA